nr:immunoglobulin heavy chain junction region [Macaca mulatta]MOX38922.1 immunoglobulin heavy chain junction region [Macaca mulatta]MOX40384.1 immunoglobulin heavy chain junction region [Macaca mulatta]MOX40783.1 immunoglobulin heavy chain junction region [Macaca mulatta]MOX41116.1 immunoglobulin heavy chain junction region [Macaca mulatta]
CARFEVVSATEANSGYISDYW